MNKFFQKIVYIDHPLSLRFSAWLGNCYYLKSIPYYYGLDMLYNYSMASILSLI